MSALLVDLDGALGDTRPLWRDWVAESARVLGVDAATLPADRVAAAAALDAAGRGELAHAARPVCGGAGAGLPAPGSRRERGAPPSRCRRHAVGVFTDAPEELARVALAQLGAARRVAVLGGRAGRADPAARRGWARTPRSPARGTS